MIVSLRNLIEINHHLSILQIRQERPFYIPNPELDSLVCFDRVWIEFIFNSNEILINYNLLLHHRWSKPFKYSGFIFSSLKR